jgi:hypothetical protein
VAIQKGRLVPTDTTKNMQNYYNDSVVSEVSEVDRGIHNGSQFVRLALQQPQPENGYRGLAKYWVVADIQYSDAPHYIDGLFTANPQGNHVDAVVVGFGDRRVFTNSIEIYSTTALSETTGDWEVSGGLNLLNSEFDNASYQGTISDVTAAIVSTPAGDQIKHTITFSTPPLDASNEGFNYWRVRRTTWSGLENVTEVRAIEPRTPTISYFNSDGNYVSSTTFDESNILDACYDSTTNEQFYTIRYNTDNVGTVTIGLGDDFGDGEAGTASGTSNFNPARWNESGSNTQFLRVSDGLSYNVSTGKGQIETTYEFAEDFDVQIDVSPVSVTTKPMWFAMRALDDSNNTVMSEGYGYDSAVTATGVVFNSYVTGLVDATTYCDIRELRPLWHNTQIGTDQFTVSYNGTAWTISGTLAGALSDAQTGATYDEDDEPNTPVSFIISCTNTVTPGEKFTFALVTASGHRNVHAAGTIGFERTGSSCTSDSGLVSGATITTGAVTIELFGNTVGSTNITADDYVVTGSGTFPDAAVFTVEKTNAVGVVQGSPLIDSLDIIGDPSKGYNDFLDGRVQIACAASGTGGGHIYIKVDNVLYKYPNSISLGSEDGGNADISTTGQIAADGTACLAWTHRSGIGYQTPFLTYLEFDETLDTIHLRTIDKDTLQDTTPTKEVLFDISGYDTNRYQVFYDQNDFDTVYYVDASTNLQAFNIDDRISAFMAINADDVTMPAGTAQQTLVNAEVVNAWGEELPGKDVTFAVTAGDGAVSPSTDTTNASGVATTQFTVGSTVGVSTITATVAEV